MGEVIFYAGVGLLFLVPSIVMLVWIAFSSYRRLGQGSSSSRESAATDFGCSMTVLTIIAAIVITAVALTVAGV